MIKKTVFLVLLFVSQLAFSQENSELTKIIIVRHAEKMVDDTKNPPLSEIGTIRAEKLKDMFADVKIDKLFSTPYIRTRATLEPLAKNRNLEITDYEANNNSFVEKLLKTENGKTIVVAGHSNSCPALVNSLLKTEKFKALSETEYGKLWIITVKNKEVIDCVLLNY